MNVCKVASRIRLPAEMTATPLVLPCYGNAVVPLRQCSCPATATWLFCYGNMVFVGQQ